MRERESKLIKIEEKFLPLTCDTDNYISARDVQFLVVFEVLKSFVKSRHLATEPKETYKQFMKSFSLFFCIQNNTEKVVMTHDVHPPQLRIYRAACVMQKKL